ncbi:MAG TPA: methyltransferase domain-containing protein [Candidatus Angelobacter sp.]
MEWFENEGFWRDFYAYMFSPERFAAAKEEVSQIIALTQCSGGSLLDLCCGPGRHSVEFAQRGFQVTGVDRSTFLLDRAREHASQANVAVEWVQEDMRRFLRPAQFDLACNLFTSFGYFDKEQDDLLVLRNLYQSLKNGGVLMIDVIGKERLARTWQSAMCFELSDGSLLLQRPQLRDDWGRVHTEWTLMKDGHTRTVSFEHNLYSGRELKDRLLGSGFSQVQLFGSAAGAPYDLNAQRLIAVARK